MSTKKDSPRYAILHELEATRRLNVKLRQELVSTEAGRQQYLSSYRQAESELDVLQGEYRKSQRHLHYAVAVIALTIVIELVRLAL